MNMRMGNCILMYNGLFKSSSNAYFLKVSKVFLYGFNFYISHVISILP